MTLISVEQFEDQAGELVNKHHLGWRLQHDAVSELNKLASQVKLENNRDKMLKLLQDIAYQIGYEVGLDDGEGFGDVESWEETERSTFWLPSTC